MEVVTPTGAALIRTLADGFGPIPLRTVESVGYGFGDRKIYGMPNALRLLIGEGHPLVAIEANIDDMNPEFYPYIIDRLLSAGAVDAGVTPMVMKKGRPGGLLHVLSEEDRRKRIISIIMKETTTFGVRYYPVGREIAERKTVEVRTKWGTVRVNVARYDGGMTSASPEHSDCSRIASRKNVPLKEVYRQAILKLRRLD